MTKTGMQKLFAGLLIVAGIVLLVMYAMLRVNKAGPSNGMFVIGLVDLFVGVVLLRRAMAAGKTL
jgi:xanthosine utilization system XapX-like protein